jgi:hypothetical protein
VEPRIGLSPVSEGGAATRSAGVLIHVRLFGTSESRGMHSNLWAAKVRWSSPCYGVFMFASPVTFQLISPAKVSAPASSPGAVSMSVFPSALAREQRCPRSPTGLRASHPQHRPHGEQKPRLA